MTMECRAISCGDLCVFCCMTSDNFESNSSESKTLSQFTILLQRFASSLEKVGTSFSNPDNIQEELNWSSFLSCCESCLLIAHNFCEDYNQLKCLELKLEYGLERLVEKIKLGGEVQSKFINLEQTVNKINEPPITLNLTDRPTSSLETASSIFSKYRATVAKLCNKRISHSVPRINLNRVTHQDYHHQVAHSNISDSTTDRNDTEFFIDNNKPSQTIPPDPLELHPPAKQSESTTRTNIPQNLKCSQCDKILKSKYYLKCHLIKHHQIWRCFNCCQDFTSRYQIMKHNSQTHKDKMTHHETPAPVVCRLCDGMFPNTHSLKFHLQMKHKEHRDKDNGWTNYINEAAFVVEERQEMDIADDQLLESPDTINEACVKTPEFETTYVQENAKTEQEAASNSEHFIKQEAEIHENCEIMEEEITFSTVKIEANVQMNLQNEIDQINDHSRGSGKCHEDTGKSHKIPLHCESNPGSSEPKRIIPSYDCVKCGKSFSNRTKLQRHNYWVHDKPHCSKCGQQFQTRLLHKEHMLTHQESPTFQCSICKRAFTRKLLMEDHLRSFHKKGPPVACKICHKTFRSQKCAGAHMLTVHGENRFHCSECGKGFKKKYHLDLHSVTHQGEAARNIGCTVCGKMFNTKEALRKHELYAQRKVQDVVTICRICKKTLVSCDTLANHYQLHHPEKKNRRKTDNKTKIGTSTSVVGTQTL